MMMMTTITTIIIIDTCLLLRRNGVTIMVNKRVRNAVLGCDLKNDRMISVSKANHSMSR